MDTAGARSPARARTAAAAALLLLCMACADAGRRAADRAARERLTRERPAARLARAPRHRGLPRLSAHQVARLRAMLDRNRDGVVSPDEVARARGLLGR